MVSDAKRGGGVYRFQIFSDTGEGDGVSYFQFFSDKGAYSVVFN